MVSNFMNLLKKIFIASVFVVLQAKSWGAVCVNATANYKMFGSVMRENVLRNPFILAFHKEHFKDYKIFYASNDTQLVSQMENMTKGKGQCSVVLGLFTSQDCLVSGPILQKNKIIGLSSSCSDNRIANFFPYVYTAVPKLSNFSKTVAWSLNHDQNSGKIYTFYQPSDVYSDAGFNGFKQYIKKPIIPISVTSSGDFNKQLFKSADKQHATIIFFTYPLPSAQILVNLDDDHLVTKNVKVIGASSWIFDVSVFKPIKSILSKAGSVLTPSLANQQKIKDSSFAHQFNRLYHRQPDIVEVLTYDMSRLAVQCYRQSFHSGQYRRQSFLQCIRTNHYQGVSGRANFKTDSPFSMRQIYLINFLTKV